MKSPIKKKKLAIKFYEDFLGGQSAVGFLQTFLNWQTEVHQKAFMSRADREKKKGETVEESAERILSICNRDDAGNPCIGWWQVKRCLMETWPLIFNAQKNKDDPKRDLIRPTFTRIEPRFILLNNGKQITKPDKVLTFAVTVKVKGEVRSFFKAYEAINAGATCNMVLSYDSDYLTSDNLEKLLIKMQAQKLGAFRERFGGFEFV